MITRLKDALNNEASTPDQVINILTTDKFEKEKLKLQLKYINGQSESDHEDNTKFFVKRRQIAGVRRNRLKAKQDMRFTERHIEMIKN